MTNTTAHSLSPSPRGTHQAHGPRFSVPITHRGCYCHTNVSSCVLGGRNQEDVGQRPELYRGGSECPDSPAGAFLAPKPHLLPLEQLLPLELSVRMETLYLYAVQYGNA